jgi:hypothetical protein
MDSGLRNQIRTQKQLQLQLLRYEAAARAAE